MAPAGALGELIGLLIALPFVALADWFKFIKQLPSGQQELAKASHGAGMLALVVYWCALGGGLFHALAVGLRDPVSPLFWVPAVFTAWGFGWFFLNARFAALSIGPPHRATIIVRALLKIAFGWAIWVYVAPLDLSGGELIGRAVALWCLATGGTKILLLLWGGSRDRAYPMVADDIEANEFSWDEDRRR